jgi:hypothetical protein
MGTSRQPLGALIVPIKQNRQFALLSRRSTQQNGTSLPCLVSDWAGQRLLWCDTAGMRPKFRNHHANTQATPNDQAGTAFLEQPSAARAIGSLSRKLKGINMSNPNRNNSNQDSTQQEHGKEQIDAATTSFASSTTLPAGFQVIATAYSDYTKRSFEDTRAFVEKLTGVRSFAKAIEIQTEFAKTAYETFVSESQKIGALYGDLAKQTYKPIGRFVAGTTPTNQ